MILLQFPCIVITFLSLDKNKYFLFVSLHSATLIWLLLFSSVHLLYFELSVWSFYILLYICPFVAFFCIFTFLRDSYFSGYLMVFYLYVLLYVLKLFFFPLFLSLDVLIDDAYFLPQPTNLALTLLYCCKYLRIKMLVHCGPF